MAGFQPCSIKCMSLEGEVLRIPGLEFDKFILNSKVVAELFKISSVDDLMHLNKSKYQKMQSVRDVSDSKMMASLQLVQENDERSQSQGSPRKGIADYSPDVESQKGEKR